MAKIEEIVAPSLTFGEVVAPATPAAGEVVIYAKSDGLLYSKDDAGVETLISGADVTGLLDETAHDALDHAGLTGIPYVAGLLDETAHDLLDHTGLTGVQGLSVTDGKEVALTTTGATTIATRTPAAAGNILVGIYFRVITATTDVTVVVIYTDATGAQINTLLDAQSCEVGSYSLVPLFMNTTAAAITVSITAGTANQVYGSASIMEV